MFNFFKKNEIVNNQEQEILRQRPTKLQSRFENIQDKIYTLLNYGSKKIINVEQDLVRFSCEILMHTALGDRIILFKRIKMVEFFPKECSHFYKITYLKGNPNFLLFEINSDNGHTGTEMSAREIDLALLEFEAWLDSEILNTGNNYREKQIYFDG